MPSTKSTNLQQAPGDLEGTPLDVTSFLLTHNPSLEVTSKLHAGYANLLEAAQTVDIMRALLPAMEEGVTVRVVIGYQLQCAILENG